MLFAFNQLFFLKTDLIECSGFHAFGNSCIKRALLSQSQYFECITVKEETKSDGFLVNMDNWPPIYLTILL